MTETTEAMIRRQEEGNEIFCTRSFLLDGALFWKSQRTSNAGSLTCRATRRRRKKKLNNEIKLTDLEALKTEELEKHLIFNSNRLRTFEDTRLEIVMYVEAKFCLRIRDSKSSHTGSREHSDPMDVDAVNSLSAEKGSSSPRDECLKYARAYFQRDCNAVIVQTSNRFTRTDRASHDPRVKIKRGVKENKKNPGESPKESKIRKTRTRVNHRKLDFSDLENSKSEIRSETSESAQICLTDKSWIHDGWSLDERNEDWSFDKWNDDVSTFEFDSNIEYRKAKRIFSKKITSWSETRFRNRSVYFGHWYHIITLATREKSISTSRNYIVNIFDNSDYYSDFDSSYFQFWSIPVDGYKCKHDRNWRRS